MRQLVAGLTILLFFVMPMPSVKAAGTTTVWDADRAINGSVTVEAGDTLRIEAGVNVTFDIPAEGNPPDLVPSLTVNGTFEVNGTPDRPVNFSGADDLANIYISPAYIWINGPGSGQPARFSNASFTNVQLIIQDSSADFSNCTFNDSEVEMAGSSVSVHGCIFQTAFIVTTLDCVSNSLWLEDCRFVGSGADSGIRPIWSDYPMNCAIGGQGWISVENCTIGDYEVGIYSNGSVVVKNCVISRCSDGIYIDSGFAQIYGCNIFGGYGGIDSKWRIHDNGSIDIRDCTISGCMMSDVSIGSDASVINCTLSESLYGIEAASYRGPLHWNFTGNTFVNDTCDIMLEGQDADIKNNTFLNENGPPGEQLRVEMMMSVGVNVSDTSGAPTTDYFLNWTDNTGFPGTTGGFDNGYSGRPKSMNLEFYIINVYGNRTNYYPYSVYAETEAGRSQTVTVTSYTRNITLVIPYSNDLSPVNITPSPALPVAGEYVSFNVTLSNRGTRDLFHIATVLLVDGVPLDSANITTLAANSSASPRFLDWKATKGPHTVEIAVDPDNAVNEYNETNNNLTISLVVSPAPQAMSTDPGRTVIWAGALAVGLAVVAAVFVRMRRKTVG